jgi:hypothetical protein
MTEDEGKVDMRATVEFHWDKKENLPLIYVIVCQANVDLTIKIIDQGGWVDRVTAENTDRSLGYGLLFGRLYALCFHGLEGCCL